MSRDQGVSRLLIGYTMSSTRGPEGIQRTGSTERQQLPGDVIVKKKPRGRPRKKGEYTAGEGKVRSVFRIRAQGPGIWLLDVIVTWWCGAIKRHVSGQCPVEWGCES